MIKVQNLHQSAYARKNDVWDSYAKRYRRSDAGDRPMDPSRVFLDFKGETIWDNLNNRKQRPYTLVKPLLIEALKEAGISFDKIRWSQKAGCRMCPCSPGFILEGNYGKDFWIEVTDDETKYEVREGL